MEKQFIGKELTDIIVRGGEVELEFDREYVIRLTGSYCKEVFAEFLRKRVTYESID